MSAPHEIAAPEWLTVDEAAARVKASKRSIYRAVRAGELRAAPINGRGCLRIAESWLREWLSRLDERAHS